MGGGGDLLNIYMLRCINTFGYLEWILQETGPAENRIVALADTTRSLLAACHLKLALETNKP